MTSKSPHHAKFAKKSKGETEWERLRNECAWPRINDMAKLVIDKNMDKANDSDAVLRFLFDESQLETFLHSHEPLAERSAEELKQLELLEKRFRDLLFLNELATPSDLVSPGTSGTLKTEATIQLSKTLLLGHRFEEALELLDSARLRSVDAAGAAAVSLSYLRLLLDAYAIRALCIEQLIVAQCSLRDSVSVVTGSDESFIDSATRRIVAALDMCIDLLLTYALEFDRRVSGSRDGVAQADSGAGAEQGGGAGGSLSCSAALAAFECNLLARLALERAAFASSRLGVESLGRLVGRLREMLRSELRAPASSSGAAAQAVRARLATTLSRALLRHVSDAAYSYSSVFECGALGVTSTAPIGLSTSESQTLSSGAPLHKVHTTPVLTPTPTSSQTLSLATGPLQRGATGRSRLGVSNSEQPFGPPPPRTLIEELLLLLSIAENLTRRNVVLSRARELSEPRRATLAHAVDVLDILTVTCARQASYDPLAERLERATAYSFNEPHVWRAFALALVEAGQPYRAYLVMREWRRMQPKNVLVCSLLARLCLEHLASSSTHFVDEAVESARIAARLEPANSRAQLLVGVACAMKARAERVREERDALQADALKAFQTACSLDPHDALAAYHVALAYAFARNLKDAAACCARAARLNPDSWYAVQLCVLVLSARREFEDAARLAAQLVEDWPDVLPLYVTKARLARIFNKKAAETLVAGLQRADTLFRDAFDAAYACGLGPASDSRSVGSPNASLTPQTVFLQRGESPLALVTEASASGGQATGSDRQSVRSDNYAPSAFGAVSMRDASAHIDSETEKLFVDACRCLCTYLRLAAELIECYAQVDRLDAARLVLADCELRAARCCACVETSLSELHNVRCSAALGYLRGLLLEYSHDYQAARDEYLSVVLSGEAHVNCLQHLCAVLMETGQLQLAEKYIRDAIAIEAQSSRSWEKLGQVLQGVGQHEAAIDCFTRALELSQTEPIEPFTVLPLPVQ